MRYMFGLLISLLVSAACLWGQTVLITLEMPSGTGLFAEPSVASENLAQIPERAKVEVLGHAGDDWWRIRVLDKEGYALISPDEISSSLQEQLRALQSASREEQERLATAEKRRVVRALEAGERAFTVRLTKSRPLHVDPVDQYRLTSRSRQLAAGTELPIVGATLSPLGLGGEYWTVDLDGEKRYVSADESVAVYLGGNELGSEARDLAFRHQAVRMAEAERKGKDLLVYGALPQPPSSVDGVDVLVPMENLDSTKVIKYLTLKLTPYNAVGDAVSDRITGAVSKAVQATGPIPPGAFRELVSEDVWYNPTIVCVEVTEVVVEYIEGGTHRLEPKNVLSEHFSNDCSYPAS